MPARWWFRYYSQTLTEESQLTTSILCFVTIMALLICSKETNITMFHDPNLRNEGTNLQNGKGKSEKMKLCVMQYCNFFGIDTDTKASIANTNTLINTVISQHKKTQTFFVLYA